MNFYEFEKLFKEKEKEININIPDENVEKLKAEFQKKESGINI